MTATLLSNIPQFTVADRMRKARETTGMDQTQFADIIGVSRGTVSNVERGTVAPRKIIVNAWALASGVPVQWLETGEAPSPDGDGASVGVRPPGLEPGTH